MPQEVMIQADRSSTIGLNKNTSMAADKTAAETFSTELDKQVKASYSKDSTQVDATRQHDADSESMDADAAKSATTEKTATEDGNNLPTASHEETAETKTPTQQEGSDTAVADETVELEEESPTRAEVSVSQQAVDHAKAAPVAMTAKAMPDNAANPASQEEAKKPVAQAVGATASEAGPQKTESAALKSQQPVAEPKTTSGSSSLEQGKAIQLSTEHNGQQKKPVLGDMTASGLEQKDGKQKPAAIRADILEALKRQSGDKLEVVATLRNQFHGRMQQENRIASTAILLNESPASETGRPSSLLTGPAVATPVMTSSSTQSSPVLPTLPIQPSMQNASWAQVMSSRVVWMAKEGVQQAELRLTPANLGPVEVRLQLHNEQANVTFLAQHAATRDALEQALPRLRDSFADAGIQLANAEVGEQQQQHHDEPEQADPSHIFIQAGGQADDIDTEAEIEQSSGEPSVGLSLYA